MPIPPLIKTFIRYFLTVSKSIGGHATSTHRRPIFSFSVIRFQGQTLKSCQFHFVSACFHFSVFEVVFLFTSSIDSMWTSFVFACEMLLLF
jgi:hypothetical protein